MRQAAISDYSGQRESQQKMLMSQPIETNTLDSDFKKYILYVSLDPQKRDALTTKVLECLSLNPKFKLHTHIQDVDILSSRPSWLQTLPTLAVKEEKRAYFGEDLLKKISQTPDVDQRRSKSKNNYASSSKTWGATF